MMQWFLSFSRRNPVSINTYVFFQVGHGWMFLEGRCRSPLPLWSSQPLSVRWQPSVLCNSRERRRKVVEAAFLMPQIVPSIVTAVAAYFVFSALGLIGTLTAVVIAHVVVALPFVVVLIRSRLETLDPDLTLASASLGAGPVKTFLLIVAPQILVSIAAAALLAFHVSFDEVVLALFLTGVRTKTLPVKLWDSILFEISPILPAISTLVIMLPVVMLVVLYAIRKWTGREQHR